MIDPALVAVFMVGLLGGVHCAGMCGGIVGALGMNAAGSHKSAASLRDRGASGGYRVFALQPAGAPASTLAATASAAPRLLAYNAGRIATYALAGALAGALGSAAWLLDDLLPVQRAAFGLTSLALVAMGLYLLGVRQIAHAFEAVGARLWPRVRPLAGRLLTGSGLPRAFAAGGVWGLVPCGMVYGVLLSALASGSAGAGASLMLAFGLGTLPNLMLMGLSGGVIRRWLGRRPVRVAAGALVLAFGVLGLARAAGVEHLAFLDSLCFTPAAHDVR